MPITPATALLLDAPFVQQEWPVLASNQLDNIEDEWKYITLAAYAVVDRDDAWRKVMNLNYFGPGGSRTNALYWTASRPPPITGFNTSARSFNPASAVKPSCASNSACDAMGVQGECCPPPGGYYIGCCPKIVPANVTQREVEWPRRHRRLAHARKRHR
jgi:hypothetical protein